MTLLPNKHQESLFAASCRMGLTADLCVLFVSYLASAVNRGLDTVQLITLFKVAVYVYVFLWRVFRN
jgi:hypothetical protein